MKITKNVVPSIAYQVRTQEGVLVDEAPVNQPLEYLHGHQNLVVGLENALEGKAVGDTFEVRVQPEEGYGEYNDAMVQRVPAEVFQGVDQLEVGMRFMAETDIGPVPVVITEVDGDEVVVDGNHMLAGQELLFSVEVVATREAAEDEIAHGHIHQHGHGGGCGCGGHGGGCGDKGDDHECCGGGHGHKHDDDHECCGGGHGKGKGGCGHHHH